MVKINYPHNNRRRGGIHLWVCYRKLHLIFYSPFSALLSYATEDLFAAGVIALMVAISTLLNFIQEARSTKAAGCPESDGQQYRDGAARN